MQRRTTTKRQAKIEFGDFQTPDELAMRVCRLLESLRLSPASIIEPTCGKGSFLRASESHFPDCDRLYGYEINPTHVKAAQESTKRSQIRCEDFFMKDWQRTLDECREPILIIGNPPWVTNSAVGAIGGTNLPAKSNFQRLNGLDAITGKSNFDISEWMLLKLLDSLAGRSAALAMLCKTAVARKVLHHAWSHGMEVESSRIYSIDSNRYFGAAVDACLLVCTLEPKSISRECSALGDLDSSRVESKFGLRDGRMIADLDLHIAYGHLSGLSPLKWRSGVKHDCSRIMELRRRCDTDLYVNGLGETVEAGTYVCLPHVEEFGTHERERAVPPHARHARNSWCRYDTYS